MRCPTCNEFTRVVETRNLIDRRRECPKKHRFDTREVIQPGAEERKTAREERRDQIIAAALAGESRREIAERFGYKNPWSVSCILAAAGVEIAIKPASKSESNPAPKRKSGRPTLDNPIQRVRAAGSWGTISDGRRAPADPFAGLLAGGK